MAGIVGFFKRGSKATRSRVKVGCAAVAGRVRKIKLRPTLRKPQRRSQSKGIAVDVQHLNKWGQSSDGNSSECPASADSARCSSLGVSPKLTESDSSCDGHAIEELPECSASADSGCRSSPDASPKPTESDSSCDGHAIEELPECPAFADSGSCSSPDASPKPIESDFSCDGHVIEELPECPASADSGSCSSPDAGPKPAEPDSSCDGHVIEELPECPAFADSGCRSSPNASSKPTESNSSCDGPAIEELPECPASADSGSCSSPDAGPKPTKSDSSGIVSAPHDSKLRTPEEEANIRGASTSGFETDLSLARTSALKLKDCLSPEDYASLELEVLEFELEPTTGSSAGIDPAQEEVGAEVTILSDDVGVLQLKFYEVGKKQDNQDKTDRVEPKIDTTGKKFDSVKEIVGAAEAVAGKLLDGITSFCSTLVVAINTLATNAWQIAETFAVQSAQLELTKVIPLPSSRPESNEIKRHIDGTGLDTAEVPFRTSITSAGPEAAEVSMLSDIEPDTTETSFDTRLEPEVAETSRLPGADTDASFLTSHKSELAETSPLSGTQLEVAVTSSLVAETSTNEEDEKLCGLLEGYRYNFEKSWADICDEDNTNEATPAVRQ